MVLYYIVLYCIVSCCIILYCIVLYCIVFANGEGSGDTNFLLAVLVVQGSPSHVVPHEA